ncbi:hypothetical protein WN55_09138 [Dufourea novaeangliae]|uniref:Uncharacterized protein n=1 Tax=Dufourea novaeangliae TaxID=178035 RepID=A0A154P823_DUFNO|nr:hypothetical protein WN55_09138 [Dufourea novaeangliae]
MLKHATGTRNLQSRPYNDFNFPFSLEATPRNYTKKSSPLSSLCVQQARGQFASNRYSE